MGDKAKPWADPSIDRGERARRVVMLWREDGPLRLSRLEQAISDALDAATAQVRKEERIPLVDLLREAEADRDTARAALTKARGS